MRNSEVHYFPQWVTRSAAALVVAGFASLTLSAPAAYADGPNGAVMTCEKIKQNCMARVARDASRVHAASDGIERPHLTASDCQSSYTQAQSTGVWPEHLPYFFAAQCTN
jgi:hypothetical protein